ncbi:MAG: MFS transporter [Candidatus Bathyarchaeota archaeon]|nr:MFS transporter [Candidatus Bathyarchaeota archaeon]
MDFSVRAMVSMIKSWVEFLHRQESPFKVNILRNFAQRFATNLTYQFQPLFLTSLGASPLVLGYLNSVNGLVNTVLAVPTGMVADRMGIKRVLVFTMLVSVVSAVVFAVANSWELAAVALVLSGAVMILDRTVCPMICGSALASGERLTGMGICDTISFFPQLIAPVLGAFLITIFGGLNAEGIRPLFYLQVVGTLIALAILQLRFRNPAAQAGGRRGNVFADVGGLFKEGRIIKRWLLLTIAAAFPWQVAFYTPLFAAQVKGADQFIVGGISAASTIVFVFFAIPLGRLSDTVGRKKIGALAACLMILSYFVMVLAPNNVILLLAGFLSGFSMSFTQNLMAISVELVPSKRLGSWVGIQGFCRGVVGIISPIICGYLWAFVFPGSVFYFLAATQIVALVMLVLVPTEITR